MIILLCIIIWMLIGSIGAVAAIHNYRFKRGKNMYYRDYVVIWSIAWTVGPIILVHSMFSR